MKPLASLGLLVTWLLVPAAASACPGMSMESHSCGLGGLGGYVAAVAIGLLVGLGSVALERRVRR